MCVEQGCENLEQIFDWSGGTHVHVEIVFGLSAVRTFIDFALATTYEIDTGGTDVGDVLGAEAAMSRRGLCHRSAEDGPGHIS